METLGDFLSFVALWLGVMVLIGLALALTARFDKKGNDETVNGEEYAKKFEEEMAEPTPEKPIKKFFRNPYVLSDDEIRETREKTEDNKD
ncbi:MAG: hypothetical protein J6Q74_01215 [Clostridia bacterium]|nr:hypothetical protein [Clostridia bacterium]